MRGRSDCSVEPEAPGHSIICHSCRERGCSEGHALVPSQICRSDVGQGLEGQHRASAGLCSFPRLRGASGGRLTPWLVVPAFNTKALPCTLRLSSWRWPSGLPLGRTPVRTSGPPGGSRLICHRPSAVCSDTRGHPARSPRIGTQGTSRGGREGGTIPSPAPWAASQGLPFLLLALPESVLNSAARRGLLQSNETTSALCSPPPPRGLISLRAPESLQWPINRSTDNYFIVQTWNFPEQNH